MSVADCRHDVWTVVDRSGLRGDVLENDVKSKGILLITCMIRSRPIICFVWTCHQYCPNVISAQFSEYERDHIRSVAWIGDGNHWSLDVHMSHHDCWSRAWMFSRY